MGDSSTNIDVDKFISFSDDLIKLLKDKKDSNCLVQILQHYKSLQTSCDSNFDESVSLLQDYQAKIESCKQRTEEASSAVTADAEIDFLEKELEEELQKEHLLREELRDIVSEFNDQEQLRVFVEERKQILKKIKQDELRAQRELSMYASVTNTIPDLNDQSKISGHIVEKEKKVVEKFEFDLTKATTFDTCNSIWKIINHG